MKKVKKEHKKKYDPQNNADSMWNRKSQQNLGGKDIQQMLGIEDEGPGSLPRARPLNLMDIITSMYEGEEEDDGHNQER